MEGASFRFFSLLLWQRVRLDRRGLRVGLEDSVALLFLSPVWQCRGGWRSFIGCKDVWIVFVPCLILYDF